MLSLMTRLINRQKQAPADRELLNNPVLKRLVQRTNLAADHSVSTPVSAATRISSIEHRRETAACAWRVQGRGNEEGNADSTAAKPAAQRRARAEGRLFHLSEQGGCAHSSAPEVRSRL